MGMGSPPSGKKIHVSPVALIHDDDCDPREWKDGLVEARLFNISVHRMRDCDPSSIDHDLHLVLISGWCEGRAQFIETLIKAQRARHRAVVIIGRDLDHGSSIEALRMGAEAVLAAELGPRRIYRRVAFFLQKTRRRMVFDEGVRTQAIAS
jgi:hypothetical protein